MRKTLLLLAAILSTLSLDAQSPFPFTWTASEEWPGFKNDIKGDFPLAGGLVQAPGFSGIFHKWGFIGDSLSSGEFESFQEDGKTKAYLDYYDYSWGQRMCAYMGATGDNYSQGGETTKGWVQHFWDAPQNRNRNIDAKADPKQAYMIALGANDARSLQPGNAKTDINLEDYTKNADTYAGWYGGIIQRVKTIQPDARFFLVTLARGRQNIDKFNEVIRDIAGMFPNTYLIELDKYAPDYAQKDFHEAFYLQGHLNPAGYEWTAWMFLNYIDWIIRHNMKDFSKVGLIGTPYYDR